MNSRDRELDGLLVLPHLRIQNANAISSPLTHGFPSMTAFLGFMWALGRKMAAAGIALRPTKIGVICHWHEEQTQDGYVKTFRLTRNPVNKDGSAAAIVEEGRIHLDVTLVLQVCGIDTAAKRNILFQNDAASLRKIAWQVRDLVGDMRIAGGVTLPSKAAPGVHVTPDVIAWPSGVENQERLFHRLRRYWLPGFALVDRQDLLQRRLLQLQAQDPGSTVLDAWLDLSRFNYRSWVDDNGRIVWAHDRQAGSGWLVPIPAGYEALTDLHDGGRVVNARDERTPFRFVESLYSIGQWVSPNRLRDVCDFLWWGVAQNGLYRCCCGYVPPEDDIELPGFSAPPSTAAAPA